MDTLLQQVVNIALEAGELLMTLRVYGQPLQVKHKLDGSPVTDADKQANALIRSRLMELSDLYPYLSEESVIPDFKQRGTWSRYWLVDPLDGTGNYIKGSDEFTVNIALIEQGRAILGVVLVPAQKKCYAAARDKGAFRIGEDKWIAIKSHLLGDDKALRVLSSRRQLKMPYFNQWLDSIKTEGFSIELSHKGSSLKFCELAEGVIDVVPCFVDTCEWDAAAAHIIAEEAGGLFVRMDNLERLAYNQKESLINPFFIAYGDARLTGMLGNL